MKFRVHSQGQYQRRTHPSSATAYKRFYKFTCRDYDERHLGLCGHGSSE